LVICAFIYNVIISTYAEAATGNNHPLESTRCLISQLLESTNRLIFTLPF